jgi:hypothetical protein
MASDHSFSAAAMDHHSHDHVLPAPAVRTAGLPKDASLAMYWSALATVLAEILMASCARRRSARSRRPGGRVLMYVGATTFFLYPRYCLFVLRLEQRRQPYGFP